MADSTRLAREGDDKSMLILERASGSYSRIEQSKPFQHGAEGVALEWRVGLLRRRTILLALIADSASLWLRVGSQEFDLRDPEVRVNKSNAVPFVRRFEVWRSDARCVKQFYWAYAHEDLSTEDDFLGFIAEISRNRTELLRTLLRYRASGQGRDVLQPEVQRELEGELRELLR